MPLTPRPPSPQTHRMGGWPRVYRTPRWSRLVFGGLGAVLVAGALAGIGYAVLGRPDGEPLVWLGLCGGLVALGAYLIAALQVERIVLHPDRIELVELGRGLRSLRRDEIVGWRLVPLQYGLSQLVVVPRGQDRRPVKVTSFSAAQAARDPWFAGLPDLDALDRARAEAELLRSEALGADEGERRASLAWAGRIAWTLRVAAFALCGWGWFAPRPYLAAVGALAALPVIAVAVALAGHGRYGLEGRREDLRPELLTPILFPGVVLGLRALLDLHLVDQRPLIPWTALGTLGLVALLLAADASLRRRWWMGLLMASLLAAHPWATAAQANVLLDRTPGQPFEVPVIDKQISRGKVIQHQLQLAPWGPVAAPERVDVEAALYEVVEPGGTVCVELHGGALGARWFSVARCR